MKNLFLALSFQLFLFLEVKSEFLYNLSWSNPATHLYQISLRVDKDQGEWTSFHMPLWRPGRYITQDFAASISDFGAMSEDNSPLGWKKQDKDTWLVKNPASGKITISYQAYAATQDAGSSYLCAEYAYFNPSNLFMYVGNRLNEACTLKVESLSQDWKAGTALKRAERHNEFFADSYHDFIDSPTIFSSNLRSLQKRIGEVDYFFHFQGNYAGGLSAENAFLNGVEKIILEQVAIFGKAPMNQYHFLYLFFPSGIRHAVEHSYSSCYALPKESMKDASSVTSMFAITSHEFWHLWNVKRIRPAALWPYRYDEEQYTSLHWFTEGVTDYYADLILARAGLISRNAFFAEISETLNSLENSYAAKKISPAQSSFDSWLSPSAYADPHLKTSYYPLGYRVGLLIDLQIRAQTGGRKSLDDVMRFLFANFYENNLGVPESGIQEAIEKVSGKDWKSFFAAYVEGVNPIPYADFFDAIGLSCKVEEKSELTWEKIGLDRVERGPYGMYVHSVVPGSCASLAGIGDKDLILSLNGQDLSGAENILRKVDEGDTLSLVFLSNGESKEVSLTCTMLEMRKRFILAEKENSSEKEKNMLDGWLQSLL